MKKCMVDFFFLFRVLRGNCFLLFALSLSCKIYLFFSPQIVLYVLCALLHLFLSCLMSLLERVASRGRDGTG